jgi:hypothetical protein
VYEAGLLTQGVLRATPRGSHRTPSHPVKDPSYPLQIGNASIIDRAIILANIII